jgi:uncharacterized caspase-like protein
MHDRDIKKTALVIGQSNYFYYDTLPNCTLDADGMSGALQKSGFTILKYQDLSRDSMIYFINKWLLSLDTYDVAVFYYSGHGVAADGVDYLVPIDGKFYTDTDVRSQGYNVNELIEGLGAGHLEKIVLLDACRGQLNRSTSRHCNNLKGSKAPHMSGTFVGFATSPGDIAYSGPKNSLSFYTSSIIHNLGKDITLKELFCTVGTEVATLTNQKQIPQNSNTLGVDICLGTALMEE